MIESIDSDSADVFAGRPGAELVSGFERRMLEYAGYGGPMGLGNNIAVIIVDVTWAFCGDSEKSERLSTVRRYPHGCGPVAWEAMPRIRRLVEGARGHGLPIIFTYKETAAYSTSGRWQDKNKRQSEEDPSAHNIVPATGYQAGDISIAKQGPSAFHGTSLLRSLVGHKIDSVIVAGTTTSGCVRATVVDAFSFNFKVAVALDGTFDRIEGSHRMSLFDMDLKYADVLPVEELIDRMSKTHGYK